MTPATPGADQRIVAARLLRYRLPLASPWLCAAGGFTQREGWLLRLTLSDGRQGYGECAPLAGTPGESPLAACRQLKRLCRQLPGQTPSTVWQTLRALAPAANHPAPPSLVGRLAPTVRAALESAILDLWSQQRSESLRAALPTLAGTEGSATAPPVVKPACADSVRVNATLGALARFSDAALADALNAAANEGFGIVKLKVGVAAVDSEIDTLRRAVQAMDGTLTLRLDANGAWNEEEATRFIDACVGLPVDSLEEPLALPATLCAPPRRGSVQRQHALGTYLEALTRLQARSPFPLAFDESWPIIANLRQWGRPADGSNIDDPSGLALPLRRLVIKPPRQGGLLPSLLLARHVLAQGLEVVVTSSIDSSCGILAAAQLAACIDAEQPAHLPHCAPPTHGLATARWLASDTGESATVAHGRLHLPTSVGLGFTPWPALAASFT
ncbi:hypothetical protein HCX48_01225 [Rhodocyclus tenuis]|uniref:Mandelate racemase/muconate lactonizing enzyme C-terminal domain-containing protein n=1 Tax=Rhodocyclus gracilis TaxID=2929842 RepID=A0ABX0WG95_9RHOO|nr:enolase C-terminal domain-like protein [Rhodocyclus gracilis]NJA87847.1 hypothetical protein [Rhodocyclus gracilis]